MPPRAQMSASEDEIGASDQEISRPAPPKINRTVVRKTAKKPAVAAAAKKATASKTKARREALKERTNNAEESDDEQAQEVEMEMEAKPKARKTKATAKPKDQDEETVAPPKKTAKAIKAKVPADPPVEEDSAPAKPARKTKAKRAPSPDPQPVIPETQPEPTEISQTVEEVAVEEMDVDREPSPPPAQKSHQRHRSASLQRQQAPGAQYPRAPSISRQPRAFSRGHSVSDTERRTADSDAKRKLSDMTKKYEDMRMKYESLQEIGHNAAESNFERLKKASDQKAKDANELIASLKKELAEIRKSSSATLSENARLQSSVSSLTSENEKLKEDAKATHTTLTESQNEAKSLTAKLEAARKTANTTDKVPGSAVKKNDFNKGGGASSDTVKEQAMKEELYRDLTGLIINSVKRRDGEDEYSCIQTGRNGTLHFHLTIATSPSNQNPKTPSGLSYEETEFAYEPLLDENRDRDLIDILPDYLSEEICFPRGHAVKFYTKVVDSMTKRIVVDEE